MLGVLAHATPLSCWRVVSILREAGLPPEWARRLDAAAVMVNDRTAFRVDWMPFAGLRESGLGIGGIPYTMHDMQVEKMVVLRSKAKRQGPDAGENGLDEFDFVVDRDDHGNEGVGGNERVRRR